MRAALVRMFVVSLFLVGSVVEPPSPAAAQVADIDICYAVSDSNADATDGDAEDLLTRVVRTDPDPVTNEESIGSGTGTRNIEAIDFHPETGVLYAADGGLLGTLDLVTGRFSAVGEGIGRGSGEGDEVNFSDIDGLAFDPTTGDLYGTHRSGSGNDLLLRIDPATGTFLAGAFGTGDYVVIPGLADLNDIDDIAIDPADGQLYGIVNRRSGGDHLVKIDKATGATTAVGPLGVDDMEGLTFASGQLVGTTGRVGNREGLWDIDKATGAAGNRRPLDNSFDYEAVACPVAASPAAAAPETATLNVSEDTRPDSPQVFSFVTAGGPLPGTFELVDGRTITYTGLPAGDYTLSQSPVAEWPLESLTCTDATGGTTTDAAAASAAISLEGGDEVTCEFVNVERQAAAGGPVPVTAPAPLPAPAEEVVGAPELPRTGRSSQPWAVLSGVLFIGGGAGIILGAPPARRARARMRG